MFHATIGWTVLCRWYPQRPFSRCWIPQCVGVHSHHTQKLLRENGEDFGLLIFFEKLEMRAYLSCSILTNTGMKVSEREFECV